MILKINSTTIITLINNNFLSNRIYNSNKYVKNLNFNPNICRKNMEIVELEDNLV